MSSLSVACSNYNCLDGPSVEHGKSCIPLVNAIKIRSSLFSTYQQPPLPAFCVRGWLVERPLSSSSLGTIVSDKGVVLLYGETCVEDEDEDD